MPGPDWFEPSGRNWPTASGGLSEDVANTMESFGFISAFTLEGCGEPEKGQVLGDLRRRFHPPDSGATPRETGSQ
jgi:hypothetical protein